ncbi:MAG: hypothetical protein ABFQ95_05850 [Pseudomonadota bacterium]
MLMVPFCREFPELAAKDRFRVVLRKANSPNPSVYEIVDLYCPENRCNCHKVSAVAFDCLGKACATIAWGWKSPGYYRNKWELDEKTAKKLSQGFLDPYGRQSADSTEIFAAFTHAVKSVPRVKKFFQKCYATLKILPLTNRQSYNHGFIEIE